MLPQTLITSDFTALIFDCDYIHKWGCLFILAPNEATADEVVDQEHLIRDWLSKEAPWVDGIFIDRLDGERYYAFQASKIYRPYQMRYPLKINNTMSMFEVIACARVSPFVTWITRKDQLIFSNQDHTGAHTHNWNAGSIAVGEAVTGAIPYKNVLTWRRQRFNIIQFKPVGWMPPGRM
jgi:hypothetical protein